MRAACLSLAALCAWGQAQPVGRIWTYSGTPTAGDCTSANYGHVAQDISSSTAALYDCQKSGGAAAWVIRTGSGGVLTIGTGLSGTSYNGSTAVTIAIDSTVATLTGIQTLTNKTLTTPAIQSGGFTVAGATSGTTSIIATATASGTITIPAATDTMVGKATTDTFTNKTFDTAGSGNVLKINGTQVSAVTGSGSVVLATSPSLTTPSIGAATGTSLAVTGGSLTARAAATQDAVVLTGRAGGTGSFGVSLTPTTLTASRTVTLADGDTTLQAGTMATTGGTLAQFAATTSAQLLGIISDETGSGSLVFANTPTLVTPNIGAATGTSLAATGGSVTVRNAATQDAVILTGRAGGTSSFGVTLTPTTLTANRTVTLADGNTTLQAGTMATTGGTLAQFAATTSAQLAGVISDETGSGSLVFGTSPTIAGGRWTGQFLGDYGIQTAAIAAYNSSTGGLYTGYNGGAILRSVSDNSGTASAMLFQIGNGLEAARLDASSNLLVGYTTSNGSYKLQVNSQIFATNATIATSDRRYKKDIMPLVSGLDVVGKLNPVSFTWKQHEIHNFDSGTQVGFIAQDVMAALADEPYRESVVKRNEVELKDGTKEEFYGMSEAKLIPILVKAIQELKAEIEILKARN